MSVSDATDDGQSAIAGEPPLSRLLERIGFGRIQTGWLAEWESPLVWYAIVVVFVEVVVLQGFNVATGRQVVFSENPLWLIRPIILVGAALTTDALFRRYDWAVRHSNLLDRTDDPDRFRGLVPASLSLVVIGAGIAFSLVNAVVVLTVPQLYAAGGPARVVRFLLVTPFGYVPVLGTFLATYISIEILLPRRLEAGAVAVDFLDPENLGGMRPIGELLKYAYYFIMIGLVGYAIATYGPYVLGGTFAYRELAPPGAVVNAVFTAAWGVAVATMAYGIYRLHRYMAREKRRELHRLDVRAREQLDEPWDIQQFDATNPPEEYETYRERVSHVTSTKEYPATFTMWTQMLVGVMIPKALQLLLAGI